MRHRTRLVEIPKSDAETAIAKARSRGGVIVFGDPGTLPMLLKLGADEVLPWSAPPDVVGETIEWARARARGRATNREVESSELAGLALIAAALGHAIRNPLAAAMINTTTITHIIGPIPADSDLHGALNDMSGSLRDIARIVSQMVALTDPGERGSCDLSRTLRELAAIVREEVELTAELTTEIPEVSCPVAMSRTRAVEIVAALLNNAVHACESVAPRRCHIRLCLSTQADMVVIDLTDDGEGMTPTVLQQALRPFFTTRHGERLGMGLAFSAMHVRRANGDIEIDSEPNVGTHVRLFLPLAARTKARRRTDRASRPRR
jgi:signal transduction histidine kinase